jgi:hypothetical protein
MGDSDRLTCHLNVDAIFNGTIAYQCQVSNDGVNFANAGPSDNASATGLKVASPVTTTAAYIRFAFTFTSSAGISAAMFDLHVLMDHA